MLGRRGESFGEGREVGHTAHRFHFFAPRQLFRQGHNIDGPPGIDQLRHAAVNAAVRVQRKIVGAKLFRRLVIGMVVEQDRA